jgi:hypothetical protein
MDYTEQAAYFTETSVKENHLYLFNMLINTNLETEYQYSILAEKSRHMDQITMKKKLSSIPEVNVKWGSPNSPSRLWRPFIHPQGTTAASI